MDKGDDLRARLRANERAMHQPYTQETPTAPMQRYEEPATAAGVFVEVTSDPWTHMIASIALTGLCVQAVIFAAPAVAVMAGMGAAAFLISAVYKATPQR